MADRDDIRRALLGAHEAGRPDSSAAGVWLLQHAQEFAEELSKFRRPRWKLIAIRLHAEFGVCSPEGGPYSGVALAQAWLRVRHYLKERGEDWVEFGRPPRGRGVRLVKRKRSGLAPDQAMEPVQAEVAPVSAMPPSPPDDLREMFSERPWVPKPKGK